MKKWISYLILLILIPIAVLAGEIFFSEKQTAWISLCVTALSCLPFFLMFEKNESDTKRLILVAVMIALSVLGRLIFAPLPGFKPVTALTIITAMYFGAQAGFMTGALTAVISNFYFGQGPWTPFQMLSWGMLGFLAGILSKPLQKSKILLSVYGLLSGIVYSLIMDAWTTVWADNYLNWSRYFASVISAIPTTVTYAVSNIIFLLFFTKPIGKILNRIKIKYGL